MNSLKMIPVAFLLCIASFFGVARADQDSPIPSPSATFTVDIQIYALMTGQTANTSTGVLTYQGKQYPFTISGIGLGENRIGAAHLVGSGVVYNLSNLTEFAGSYEEISGGIMETGHAKLISKKNVGIHLIGSTNGPVVISPSGAIVKFTN